MVERIHSANTPVEIALVGKYTQLHDAYLSVVESLFHAGTDLGAVVKIRWVESETVTPETAATLLGGCAGILVPGGFGDRGNRRHDRRGTICPHPGCAVPGYLPGHANCRH